MLILQCCERHGYEQYISVFTLLDVQRSSFHELFGLQQVELGADVLSLEIRVAFCATRPLVHGALYDLHLVRGYLLLILKQRADELHHHSLPVASFELGLS
jgi:hypothetical protein